MMDLLLLALLLLSQGVHGSHRHEADFRFCGDRQQKNQSWLIYEKQAENITIENSAEMFKIRAPFPANLENVSLSAVLGPYRFCIYWYQRDSSFNLTYGKSNYTLSTKADISLCFSTASTTQNKSGIPVLFNVSYAHDEGLQNASLRSAAVYSFPFHDCKVRSVRVPDIEQELRNLENYMKKVTTPTGRHTRPRAQYEKLLHLESNLREVEFEGENKTFGTSTVRATVWKIGSSKASQDLPFTSKLEAGKEVQGFAVNLPSLLFAKAKRWQRSPETRVLLVEINSQALFQNQNGSKVLGEKVIGITVGDTSISGLQRDVVLKFFHDQRLRNVTPHCVFWNASSASGNGSWKSDGCETETSNSQTVCRCNHLTYFAVLMVSSPEIDPIHKENLTNITYVGCIISALASLFTIIFFFSRRRTRDSTVTIYIHMNLLGAILLLDVSFLLSQPLASIGSEVACKASAMFLHFSLLCCLAWMGIEGYNLYKLVVEVFNTFIEHFILKLCLVGWGLPIFVVVVIFLADQTNYGPVPMEVFESLENSSNTTICWIRAPRIHNIVNLGCFSLVLLFNCVMLGAMVWEIFRQRKKGHKCKYALVLLGLSLVLGLPWALAFFSFSSGSFQLVTLYLFTIINSLQGFLIFLWFWTMVLQARKPCHSPSSYDSVKLQSSTHHTGAD
ncbi:adhesion G-protein coupled receptor G1 isoform X2 [Emydura macquarii macquarii]